MWEGFFTGYLNYGLNCREKNEEIFSRNFLPHYKRASSFTNKREAAWLHLLPNLSRYRRMSESVQHDEQCPSLHNEGLKESIFFFGKNIFRCKNDVPSLSFFLLEITFYSPEPYSVGFEHSYSPNWRIPPIIIFLTRRRNRTRHTVLQFRAL